MSINSVQSGQFDVLLNGAADNAEVFGGITIPPIPDAIQEMKLQTGDNSADLDEFYGSWRRTDRTVFIFTKTAAPPPHLLFTPLRRFIN